MEEIRISAEQFRRELTTLLSQAGYGSATVVIERHGTPLAALIPYQEYQRRMTGEGTPRVMREPAAVYEVQSKPSYAGVLTLEEAADHLRTTTEAIRKQAESGEIPARKLGEIWRFSRTALDNWLQPQDSRSTLLAQVGLFAGDTSLDEMIASIYDQRGRSETDSIVSGTLQ